MKTQNSYYLRLARVHLLMLGGCDEVMSFDVRQKDYAALFGNMDSFNWYSSSAPRGLEAVEYSLAASLERVEAMYVRYEGRRRQVVSVTLELKTAGGAIRLHLKKCDFALAEHLLELKRWRSMRELKRYTVFRFDGSRR